MSTILDTLITDRTQEDVDRASYLNGLWDPRALQWRGTPQERAEWEAGPRGAYGFADMNRVVQAARQARLVNLRPARSWIRLRRVQART